MINILKSDDFKFPCGIMGFIFVRIVGGWRIGQGGLVVMTPVDVK